jgi:hypothetical protein
MILYKNQSSTNIQRTTNRVSLITRFYYPDLLRVPFDQIGSTLCERSAVTICDLMGSIFSRGIICITLAILLVGCGGGGGSGGDDDGDDPDPVLPASNNPPAANAGSDMTKYSYARWFFKH